MSQQCTMKSRPLGKDEVLFLLEQIIKHRAITSKATNATNNKLKEEAWKTIAQEFSAMAGEMRRPEQLRLKWENLKKAARKRSAMIRQNNLKTGGGKMYIPRNETLDCVASMLNRCNAAPCYTAWSLIVNKRRKLCEELQAAQRDKELAMAAYFKAKTEKVELENTKLKLEIEQLKRL